MKNLSRKEAAEVLEGMKVKIEIPKAAVTQWKRNTALDMAIEVLKYSEVPNSSDCISRQAAIDAINEYMGGKRCDTDGTMMARLINELVIKQLPSIQPKRGRWIDRGERGDWEWQADGRGKHWHEWECDQCKGVETKTSNFCPDCGAKMEVTT